MKWVWMLVTILLAVSGTIGGYNTIETLIRGNGSLWSVFQLLLAIGFLFLATKTYTRAKAG